MLFELTDAYNVLSNDKAAKFRGAGFALKQGKHHWLINLSTLDELLTFIMSECACLLLAAVLLAAWMSYIEQLVQHACVGSCHACWLAQDRQQKRQLSLPR